MRRCVAFLLLSMSSFGSAEPEPLGLRFGVFVDTYYAYDVNAPRDRERALTTLPSRSNEFALNLAHLETSVSSDRVRGRFALQNGTSVKANYGGELRSSTSGSQLADLLEAVQEARVGYQIADGFWIDAGIYFSHIGAETFLSRDNWTYTRSLVADFSPYYQSGIKLTWDRSPRWSFQFHLINGWQNLVETNTDKALGTQVVFRPHADWTITHNTFFGHEAQLRLFQDFNIVCRPTARWEVGLTLDHGFQRRLSEQSFATWYGTSLQSRHHLDNDVSLTFRIEAYADPEGVVVTTNTAHHFQTVGASVNLDQKLTPELLWRTELRGLVSRDPVFPSDTQQEDSTVFGITSLAFSL